MQKETYLRNHESYDEVSKLPLPQPLNLHTCNLPFLKTKQQEVQSKKKK